ncbi:MAG: hypothetical protein H6734_24540 [Alphaproteobacteria bacterium]|nr:hypothetical protein [Alphaproteobacteria bacterium]
MIALLVVATALAAPAGYSPTKQVNGCQLYLGPRDADGVTPMAAECHWPEVTIASFDAKLADWNLHDEIFSSVAESRVLRVEGGRSLVKQTHVSSGISDREIIISGQRVALDDGGFRYEWRPSGQPIELQKGNVECPRSEGFWQVRPSPEGGVLVSYELHYDPGGSVPGFLVRWFQTSGLTEILTNARAATHP